MQLSHHANKRKQEEAAADLVLDAIPSVNRFICKQMRQHRKGLSLPQFRTLLHVDQQPNNSLSSLAEYLGSSASTASRIVSGLVAKGLLSRGGSVDDRRELTLVITPRGRAVLDAAWSGAQAAMKDELGGLTPAQRTTLIAGMDILKSVFGTVPPADCTTPPTAATRAPRLSKKG